MADSAAIIAAIVEIDEMSDDEVQVGGHGQPEDDQEGDSVDEGSTKKAKAISEKETLINADPGSVADLMELVEVVKGRCDVCAAPRMKGQPFCSMHKRSYDSLMRQAVKQDSMTKKGKVSRLSYTKYNTIYMIYIYIYIYIK